MGCCGSRAGEQWLRAPLWHWICACARDQHGPEPMEVIRWGLANIRVLKPGLRAQKPYGALENWAHCFFSLYWLFFSDLGMSQGPAGIAVADSSLQTALEFKVNKIYNIEGFLLRSLHWDFFLHTEIPKLFCSQWDSKCYGSVKSHSPLLLSSPFFSVKCKSSSERRKKLKCDLLTHFSKLWLCLHCFNVLMFTFVKSEKCFKVLFQVSGPVNTA